MKNNFYWGGLIVKELINCYPLNLIYDILEDRDETLKVYIPGFYSALNTLTEREVDILQKRYIEGMTLRTIALAYGLTSERIRQIKARAIRKLRHPSRKILFQAVPMVEVQKQKVQYQKLCQEYEFLAEVLNSANNLDVGRVTVEVLDIPLSELNLSVRSYNCLRRASKNTLKDITDMTEPELKRIRNLGNKSADEIIDCLKRHGLELRKVEELNGRTHVSR
jgi:DNA-binding CsgD family transcriptional regulator